jgi:hypothetical protein
VLHVLFPSLVPGSQCVALTRATTTRPCAGSAMLNIRLMFSDRTTLPEARYVAVDGTAWDAKQLMSSRMKQRRFERLHLPPVIVVPEDSSRS